MKSFVRIGVVALGAILLLACGSVATLPTSTNAVPLPTPSPSLGTFSSTIAMRGVPANLNLHPPTGFQYRPVSNLATSISEAQAETLALQAAYQGAATTAPITVVTASLGQYKVDNIWYHIPTTTAWIVLLHSTSLMQAKNGPFVSSCAYGLQCGGHYMLLSVDATSGQIVAPFVGGVFG